MTADEAQALVSLSEWEPAEVALCNTIARLEDEALVGSLGDHGPTGAARAAREIRQWLNNLYAIAGRDRAVERLVVARAKPRPPKREADAGPDRPLIRSPRPGQ